MTNNNKPNYVNQLHIKKDHHLTAVTGAGVLLGSTVLLGQQTKVHAAKNNESATDHTMIVNKSASSQQKQVQLHHTSVVSAISQSVSVASQQSTKNISAASQASQSSTEQQSQATNHNSQTKSSVSNSQAQTNHNQSNVVVKSTTASQQPSQSQTASSAVNKNNVTSQTKPTNNSQSTAKSAVSAASESQSVNKVTTNAKSDQSNSQQAAKSMTSVTTNQQTTAKSVASQSISVASQQSAKNISATSQASQHMTSTATIQNSQSSQLTNDVNNSTNTTKAQDLQRLQTLLQTEANYAANNYQEAFIEQIANAAIAIANKYDLYPSVMMAQAILESGWGQSGLSINDNNYFGVKGSYDGQSVDVPTQEWNGYQMVTINDYFKKYPNAEASFEDYAKVFTGSAWARNFYRGVFRKNAPTYQDATAWLTGRYATDPNYNIKLNQLIQEYDLSRFDQEVTNTPNSNGVIDTDNTNADTSKPQTTQKTYIVKSGDTVWGISQQFDTTVKQIVSWNNLANANVIYVGQVLNVSAPVTQQTNSDNKQNQDNYQKQTDNNDDSTITYTVKAGDTVWGISQKYQVSTTQITQLNHLSNDNIIYVGQVLTIKQGHHSDNQVNNNTTTQNQNMHNNNGTVTYTVKAGDTLWGISQQFNTTVSHLQSTNHINGSTIYVGQTLTISGNQASNNTFQSQTTNNNSNYQTTTYTVKAGDTLWGISQEYNTSVNKLMSANHLNDTTIYVGQVLDINPVASGNVTLSRPQVQQNSAYYTAKAGDSLWSIAQANGTSVADLKQLNNLSSNMILVGQRLRVR